MGVVCCNKITDETKKTELTLKSDTGIMSVFLGLSTRLIKSKTMGKKGIKKVNVTRAITDAVLISPSQFVMENQGILSDCYEFEKQLGQGKY